MGGEISPELKDFIARHVQSVEHLEVLLLLHLSRERAWTVGAVARELRGNELAIARWLDLLVATGLAQRSGEAFSFRSDSADATRQTENLAALYRERAVKVIEFIYARPNSQLRDFSEAFKFRRKT